ncbi:MAG TPA: hydantoinase/oxoprolinase family protein [Candidatus Acidoferrales bacterium]|nr:hydantoinase/oxoprolinase family protein [Candidatus Acidoferrales bacterium]
MRIAMDAGGTFTDCVFVRDGKLEVVKVPSTPTNPADAIVTALESVLPERDTALELTLGTTVGTNAILQRKGGRAALVTTSGFEDVLEIGRQARPKLYDFFVERTAPLVPSALRFGLKERVSAEGRALQVPSRGEIRRVVTLVRASGAESVAVCLLFSFVNPANERAISRALRAVGLEVSVSHEILPEFREFERTATTAANAYLAPVMATYLARVSTQAQRFATARSRPRVRVMQSSGGIVDVGLAAREPVRTVLSGPAGGIVGAEYVAKLAGFERIITFDMGGTSTDVALSDGGVGTTNESQIAELPIAVPMLEIHTVGAGGGSLARFDRAGALRVGPESAGADPGPICYGRGERPTVTDAHLMLGRISERGLLDGSFPLHAERTRRIMSELTGALGAVERFAQGIIEVANSVMEKAIRVISVERGHDPRDYTLVAFGGAGGLHACDLAASLAIPRVLIPRLPGGLSALGILRSDVIHDYSQTVRLVIRPEANIMRETAAHFARLESRGRSELRREQFAARSISMQRFFDVRYVGQAYELTVPAGEKFLADFHRLHERRYGYSDPKRATEIVNVRLRAIGIAEKPNLNRLPARNISSSRHLASIADSRSVSFSGRSLQTRIYDRAKLMARDRFSGPAVVTEYSGTTVIPPDWTARVDEWGNLLLERLRAVAKKQKDRRR